MTWGPDHSDYFGFNAIKIWYERIGTFYIKLKVEMKTDDVQYVPRAGLRP